MATTKKLMGTTAVGGGALAIEDVFSTYLYAGNGSTQTITNGIDLAGEGGAVWIKKRFGGDAENHTITDTERGANKKLETNTTDVEYTDNNALTSFNSDGFSLGAEYEVNDPVGSFASWTFRKAPRFFDVVTYTGDGTNNRQISHNLGVQVGCVICKSVSGISTWAVKHRSSPSNEGQLNSTNAFNAFGNFPSDYSGFTDTYFTVNAGGSTNADGASYVAYLFAHDPLGPSGDGSDGLIACGSYTGNGSTTGPEIDLGWEPQWVMIKETTNANSWAIWDSMRGITDTSGSLLFPNLSNAELVSANYPISLSANGFQPRGTNSIYNASGRNYIYIAIRRGPMRQPESGTEVFAMDTYGSTGDGSPPGFRSPFPVDFAIRNDTSGANHEITSRLTAGKWMYTNLTNAEASVTNFADFDYQNGWSTYSSTASNYLSHMWRRAPGFFDVVAYTGDGTFDGSYNVNHSLGVIPEMIITKSRSDADYWSTYHSGLTSDTYQVQLNLTNGQLNTGQSWGPATETFKPQYAGNANYSANHSGRTYIAYLFATLPGVSKVGSYTGSNNVGEQVIDCGFTSGARFVLFKNVTGTGEWYFFDSVRGITVGSADPVLMLDNTNGGYTEATWAGADMIQPDPSGFKLTTNGQLNNYTATYIFYAIA